MGLETAALAAAASSSTAAAGTAATVGATAAAAGAGASAAGGAAAGMALGTKLTIASGALGAAGSVAGVMQGKAAVKDQMRAQKIQQKQQAYQTNRERRKQFAAARQSQAELRASSFAQGTAQTSRTSGISGNIQQQAGTNVGFLNQSEGFTSATGARNVAAAGATSRANTFNALAGLGFQGAQFGANAKGTGLFD